MLLTFDVGNSQTVLGLFDHDNLSARAQIPTQSLATLESARTSLQEAIQQLSLPRESLEGVIVANVVPAVEPSLTRAIATVIGRQALFLNHKSAFGLAIACDPASEVGADRIANALAALTYSKPHGAIVVDFGTATTFDCVSPENVYLGGLITVGAEIGARALAHYTARLPEVELNVPPSIVGANTEHAIQSGLLYGHAAMVDGIVQRLQLALPFEVKLFATGGLAKLIGPLCQTSLEVNPHLTLQGIRLAYERIQHTPSA